MQAVFPALLSLIERKNDPKTNLKFLQTIQLNKVKTSILWYSFSIKDI